VERKFLCEKEPKKDREVRPYHFTRVFKQGFKEKTGEVSAASLEKRAFEEAYAAGEKAGFEAGMEQATMVLRRVEHLIVSLEKIREETYAQLEEEILALTLRIAEKIVHREISRDPSAFRVIVSMALEKVKEADQVFLRVSPSDFGMIQDVLPAISKERGISSRIIMREDPTMSPGGCILETDHCEIDTRIERALETIEKALRK